MGILAYEHQLEAGASAVASLVRGVSTDQARWRPGADAWSILEVVNHLYDEEREDFRLRLDLSVHHPEQPLPDIDPQGWVAEREYNARDLDELLERFLAERGQSLVWLRTLRDPDWTHPCNHPRLGGITTGDLLVSWVAHDLLHLRQLVELRYTYLAAQAVPYTLEYAGTWS
jgi:hypothetical protein